MCGELEPFLADKLGTKGPCELSSNTALYLGEFPAERDTFVPSPNSGRKKNVSVFKIYFMALCRCVRVLHFPTRCVRCQPWTTRGPPVSRLHRVPRRHSLVQPWPWLRVPIVHASVLRRLTVLCLARGVQGLPLRLPHRHVLRVLLLWSKRNERSVQRDGCFDHAHAVCRPCEDAQPDEAALHFSADQTGTSVFSSFLCLSKKDSVVSTFLNFSPRLPCRWWFFDSSIVETGPECLLVASTDHRCECLYYPHCRMSVETGRHWLSLKSFDYRCKSVYVPFVSCSQISTSKLKWGISASWRNKSPSLWKEIFYLSSMLLRIEHNPLMCFWSVLSSLDSFEVTVLTV